MWKLFLSTPSARRATKVLGEDSAESKFLSTPSARRATRSCRPMVSGEYDFYPRPPRGGRPERCQPRRGSGYFYPRPPRGGRRMPSPYSRKVLLISIHALREEGDGRQPPCGTTQQHFYPRPPRGGRPDLYGVVGAPVNFYPRPPRGGRPPITIAAAQSTDFYPRPPRGGRQFTGATSFPEQSISIHALREEGDLCPGHEQGRGQNFYPRPPRGGRPRTVPSLALMILFLSTPSARRATPRCTRP